MTAPSMLLRGPSDFLLGLTTLGVTLWDPTQASRSAAEATCPHLKSILSPKLPGAQGPSPPKGTGQEGPGLQTSLATCSGTWGSMTPSHPQSHGLLGLALSLSSQGGARGSAKPGLGPLLCPGAQDRQPKLSTQPSGGRVDSCRWLLPRAWTATTLWCFKTAFAHVGGAAELLTTPTLPLPPMVGAPCPPPATARNVFFRV